VVHTNDDIELAEQIAGEMADWAWQNRQRFVFSERVASDAAVQSAVDAAEGLVILSDTGDSVYGGAPGNSVHILDAILQNSAAINHAGLFLVPIIDGTALQQAIDSGRDTKVELSVGSHIGEVTGRVTLTGIVASVSLGHDADIGERGSCEIGRSAVVSIGSLRLVLLEQRTFAINHPVLYQHHGIDVASAKAVVVKTASNFQFFAEWRKQMVRVDSPGATQSDLLTLPWKKLTHPVWPFDDSMDWPASDE
jgi:microcystin degradation protein MlrC